MAVHDSMVLGMLNKPLRMKGIGLQVGIVLKSSVDVYVGQAGCPLDFSKSGTRFFMARLEAISDSSLLETTNTIVPFPQWDIAFRCGPMRQSGLRPSARNA